MSGLSQYDGWTIQDVVAKNSHELTAMQLLGARQYILEQRRDHANELAAAKSTLSEAQRVGLAVLRAQARGRKTVRLADLINGGES